MNSYQIIHLVKDQLYRHQNQMSNIISTNESHIATKVATYICCFRCSTKKHDRRSNIICATCNKVLCKYCFAEYHKT